MKDWHVLKEVLGNGNLTANVVMQIIFATCRFYLAQKQSSLLGI